MSFKEISVEDVYKSDDKLKKEDVNAIIEWMEKQPHLPKATELQIALFLHSCYYSNELAKNTIDIYFTVKTICTDIFGYRNINEPLLHVTLKTVCIYPLPKLTSDGSLVMFCSLVDTNPDNYFQAPQVNLFDMVTLAYLHQYGPTNGVHIVLDMKGVVFAHFLKLSPVIVKKFLYYLQEGMPIRLKSLHFVNTVSFMDKVLALMKPFMKKELIDSLCLHTDTTSLFKKLPKEIFPQDLGGQAESIQILQEKTRCLIVDNPDFWKFQINQTVDESKRQGRPKNISEIFGMEGSFKKLEVD